MKKLFWLVILGGLILDQGTKYLAMLWWRENPVVLMDGFFRLTYSENVGIAFGVPIPVVVLLPLSVILMGMFIWLMDKEFDIKKARTVIFLGLVVSGGLGNLIDRVMYGFVVDFISISRYPIFNLADVFILVGALGAIVFYGKLKKNN